MTKLTNKSQLVSIFKKYEKPADSNIPKKIGIEQESFVLDLKNNNKPIVYEQTKKLLEYICELEKSRAFLPNPKLVLENKNPIGISSSKGSITLEPGGQLELSGAAYEHLEEAEQELQDFKIVLDLCEKKFDFQIIQKGFLNTAELSEINFVPKERYKIMAPVMQKLGTRGLDMMKRSATIQANLDYENEAQMVRYFRFGLKIAPIVNQIFNSDLDPGFHQGNLSERADIWANTDPNRCGAPKVVFESDFGYAKWIDWVAQVPMYFIKRSNKYIDVKQIKFDQFLEQGFENFEPEIKDFEDHLSTIFTEVRLKPHLEMRSADSGSVLMALALGALYKGLFYNSEVFEEAENLLNINSKSLISLATQGLPKSEQKYLHVLKN